MSTFTLIGKVEGYIYIIVERYTATEKKHSEKQYVCNCPQVSFLHFQVEQKARREDVLNQLLLLLNTAINRKVEKKTLILYKFYFLDQEGEGGSG